MFKEPFEYIELKDHPDHRGNLFEMLRFKDQAVPGEGQIYCFTIKPGVRRGDHYHDNKREWATCVSGKVFVLLDPPNGERTKIILDSQNPAVIYFHPGTSHAFVNESDIEAVVVSYSSTQHYDENPDTFPKIVDDKGL